MKRLSNREVEGATFKVSVRGIHEVQYTEGNRVARIEIEGGTTATGRVDWVIYGQTLRGWEPPHYLDEMSVKERDLILDRVSRSLDLLEMPHRIVK